MSRNYGIYQSTQDSKKSFFKILIYTISFFKSAIKLMQNYILMLEQNSQINARKFLYSVVLNR